MENRGKNKSNSFEKNLETNGYHVVKNGSTPNIDKNCAKCRSSNGLHHFICQPTHLRFNEFIQTGYRVDLSTWECLKSLFYIHNESFNIYSHGIAAIMLVLLSPYFYRKINLLQFDPILFPIHHITCITCVLFSSIYHLMLCHKEGGSAYRRFVMLDYFGILVVTGLCCISFLKATYFCFPKLGFTVTLIYFIVGVKMFVNITKGTNAKTRIRPLIYLGVFRILFVYPARCIMISLGYTTGPLGVLWYMSGIETIGLFAGVINLSHIPEKWFQGKFDYAFNSHNIMHLLVLLGPAVLHGGTVMDFEWMEKTQCPV